MEYNFLGNTGLKVSSLCLGTSTFGSQQHTGGRPACDDETAVNLLNIFTEAGGNFIDTADMYSDGGAERIIGKWLTGKERQQHIITTKVGSNGTSNDVNDIGMSRSHLVHSLEKSLNNLQSPYVDIYMLHRFDRKTSVERVMRTLNDFVRCGKVHYIGVSNYTGWQLQKTVDVCKYMGLEPVTVLQNEYNLLTRYTELEMVDVCKEEGVSLTPWGALKGGWLTGKIKKGNVPDDSRIAWATKRQRRILTAPGSDDYNNDHTWDLLDTLTDIAQNHGVSVSQVSIRWLLQQSFVPSVMVGTTTAEQLRDNLGAGGGWSLSEEEMQRIDQASQYTIPDPYYVNAKWDASRQ